MFDDAYFVRLGEILGICNAAAFRPWRQGSATGSDWSRETMVFDEHGRQVAVCTNGVLSQCRWNARFIATASVELPRIIDDVMKVHSLIDGRHEETFDGLITQLEEAQREIEKLRREKASAEMRLATVTLLRDLAMERCRAAVSQGSINVVRRFLEEEDR